MKNEKLPLYETVSIIVGEIITSLVLCAVFLIIGKFDASVAFGASLGSAVTVINFIFLVLTANRAVDKAMADRGDGEMSDEEASKFAEEHKASLAVAIKVSYIVRTASIAGALLLAFLLSDTFNVIATVIPLVMYRPIITLSQIIKKKQK